jgi:hypothetical protein
MRRIVALGLVYSLITFIYSITSPFVAGAAASGYGYADVTQSCSDTIPGATAATFHWQQAGGALQIWVDISLFDNGFRPGTFVAAGPLGPQATSYTWHGIEPHLPHYYRVNALYPEGWRVLKTGSFVSGHCNPSAALLLPPRQQCSTQEPGKVQVTFRWSPALGPNAEQWLDLSLFDNDFAWGTFVAVGPLENGAWEYTWDGLVPGAKHYWRLNTLHGQAWHPSTGSFMTLSCGASAAPNPALLRLRENLAWQIQQWSFDAAVAVTDLQTGESIDVNGDVPHYAGCSINFFVLLSVVMDLEQGRYPESYVGDLIARTIYSSNPITARTLLIQTAGSVPVGVSKMNEFMRRLGLQVSFYDHPPAYFDEFSLMGRSNILTANEINSALASFYHGGIVSFSWRDYLMDKMVGVKPGLQYLIPAGVSGGVVSHKNGFSWVSGGYVDNDIGIVTFSRGGVTYAYAISFFTQNVTVEYADISLGQTVSRLVWQYFSNRYP